MALNLLSVDAAATSLLTCVCDSLALIPTEVPGLDGCPCRTFVTPGQAAADGCDEGCADLPAGQYPGQLTVNVVRIYTTTREKFPRYEPSSRDSVLSGKACAPQPITAVDLLVTLFRCVPLPSDAGCPPTPAALGESARQLHVDMLAIERGILCCFAATDTTQRNGRRFTLGQSAVIGPRGGCVGVEQQITVALDSCIPCPPVTP